VIKKVDETKSDRWRWVKFVIIHPWSSNRVPRNYRMNKKLKAKEKEKEKTKLYYNCFSKIKRKIIIEIF
jgi:hypothetical protein